MGFIRLVQRIIIFQIMTVIPLFFSLFNYDPFLFPKETIFVLLCGYAGICLAIRAAAKEKLNFPLIKLFIPLMFFCIVSVFFSRFRYESFSGLTCLFAALLLFYVLTNIKKTVYSHIDILLCSAGFFQILLMILQYFNMENILPHHNYPDYMQIKNCFGTFGNKNFLASFLVFTVPSALRSLEKKYLKIVYVLCCTVSVVFLGARSAFIALVLIYAVFLFRKRGGTLSLKQAVAVVGIFVVFSLIITISGSYGLEKYETLYKSSIAQRFAIWRTGTEMLKEFKFEGFGLCCYDMYHFFYQGLAMNSAKMQQYFCRADRLHNDFVQIIIETGILSLLIFFIAAKILADSFENSGNYSWYSSLIFIPFFSESLFSFPVYLITASLFFIYHAAVCENTKNDTISELKPIFTRQIFPAALFLAVYITILVQIVYFESNYFFGKGEYQYIFDYPGAFESYRKAVILNNNNGMAWQRLAEIETAQISEVLASREEDEKNGEDTDAKARKILLRARKYLDFSRKTFTQPAVYHQQAKISLYLFKLHGESPEIVEKHLFFAYFLDRISRPAYSRLYDFYEETENAKKQKELVDGNLVLQIDRELF